MSKYAFFYPENGQRFPLSLEFDTPEEAIEYWKDKRCSWDEIAATGKDKAAFLSPFGDVVVLRELQADFNS